MAQLAASLCALSWPSLRAYEEQFNGSSREEAPLQSSVSYREGENATPRSLPCISKSLKSRFARLSRPVV
jgi:hypothetical protein